jgi:hypothetical protein
VSSQQLPYVEVWKAGERWPTRLHMGWQTVASHLLSDWLPSVPVGQSASFFGWPKRLLVQHYGMLTLSEQVQTTERQWKGMISWMLGVAGTRFYLTEDGYRWIAPVSAFFEERAQLVDVQTWNLSFPQPDLVAERRTRGICPDYFCARSSANGRRVEWAVAEAKGTPAVTRNTSCTPAWRKQVKNIKITYSGGELAPDRFIVVATRVNPKGPMRNIGVKAWNSAVMNDVDPFARTLPEIVCAHLFGFYRGIGLEEVANRLALSVARRSRHNRRVNLAWEKKLQERRFEPNLLEPEMIPHQTTPRGIEDPITVRLSDPLRKLTHLLSTAEAGSALEVVRQSDRELDRWWSHIKESAEVPGTVALNFGAVVAFGEA